MPDHKDMVVVFACPGEANNSNTPNALSFARSDKPLALWLPVRGVRNDMMGTLKEGGHRTR